MLELLIYQQLVRHNNTLIRQEYLNFLGLVALKNGWFYKFLILFLQINVLIFPNFQIQLKKY